MKRREGDLLSLVYLLTIHRGSARSVSISYDGIGNQLSIFIGVKGA